MTLEQEKKMTYRSSAVGNHIFSTGLLHVLGITKGKGLLGGISWGIGSISVILPSALYVHLLTQLQEVAPW